MRSETRIKPIEPRWRRVRRGSAYTMVLALSMLVTVVGLGALAAARVSARVSSSGNEWIEADTLAFTAAEHAVSYINDIAPSTPTSWRSGFVNGQTAFESPYHGGRIRWVLEDEDGNLADDYADPIRLYAIGTAGRTTRVYSVTLNPGGSGLEVLRTAYHADRNVVIGSGTAVAQGGPVSTNGSVTLTGGFRGTTEAGAANAANRKPMPSPQVFDFYKEKATTIPSAAASTGAFQPAVLTAGNNPYGAENAAGVYYLRLPDVSSVTISASRIKGTLVVENHPDRGSQELRVEGAVFWEPGRADHPILITKGLDAVRLEGASTPLYEGGTAYPSELRGLIHTIGTDEVRIGNWFFLRGTIVADGTITTSGYNGVQVDRDLYLYPPQGYSKGDRMEPAGGTWRWDELPD